MADKNLSERDICTKYITPALQKAGWDLNTQIREEVSFTAGRINVRGKTVSRGSKKRADYILYYKNNLPIAVIEAKDGNHAPSDGIQQALGYGKRGQGRFFKIKRINYSYHFFSVSYTKPSQKHSSFLQRITSHCTHFSPT